MSHRIEEILYGSFVMLKDGIITSDRYSVNAPAFFLQISKARPPVPPIQRSDGPAHQNAAICH